MVHPPRRGAAVQRAVPWGERPPSWRTYCATPRRLPPARRERTKISCPTVSSAGASGPLAGARGGAGGRREPEGGRPGHPRARANAPRASPAPPAPHYGSARPRPPLHDSVRRGERGGLAQGPLPTLDLPSGPGNFLAAPQLRDLLPGSSLPAHTPDAGTPCGLPVIPYPISPRALPGRSPLALLSATVLRLALFAWRGTGAAYTLALVLPSLSLGLPLGRPPHRECRAPALPPGRGRPACRAATCGFGGTSGDRLKSWQRSNSAVKLPHYQFHERSRCSKRTTTLRRPIWIR